jgi:DNA-directed RNA polymerase sigma subunit (sigma70/sigma32)
MAKDRVDRDDEDLVRLYLSDIGQYTLLTKDDEVHLAQTIEEGREAKAELDAAETDKKIKITPSKKLALKRAVHRGDTAERDFVQSNLRLVVSIAKKYQASGLPLLDLIQEGNLGLMHAVEKFDWRKGFQVLDLRHLVDSPGHHPRYRQYGTHHPPPGTRRRHTGASPEGPVASGTEVRPPADHQELCDECEMPEDKLIEALRFRSEPISLSEPLREDGDAELGDVVEDRSAESPFDVAAVKMMPAAIEKLLQPLDEREQKILRMRFGLDGAERFARSKTWAPK